MSVEITQEQAERLYGVARFHRYLDDTHDDVQAAIELAHWNQEFAGLLHVQLGYVELAVRNAIDRQKRADAQKILWSLWLCHAFPSIADDDYVRRMVASRLSYLRNIRNRAAHFDNLYLPACEIRNFINTLYKIFSVWIRLLHLLLWIDKAYIGQNISCKR